MRQRIGRIILDVRNGHYVDLYATTLVSFVFAALMLIGEELPENLRWSLLFAGLGILLLRTAVVLRSPDREEVLLDRSDYEKLPIGKALGLAKDVWIFAPVGTNLLTGERCELLRQGPLSRSDGSVRIVVLEPFEAQTPLAQQLDALLDYPVQTAAAALAETNARLAVMSQWKVQGSFAYGTLPFNPGFSIVAVDPGSSRGFVNIEFHGFRNDTVASRMHIHLTRADQQWYLYWLKQFEAIWRSARNAHPGNITGSGIISR